MSTGYSWEGIRQVRATLLGARHVRERLCGGYVYLGRYISVRPLPLPLDGEEIMTLAFFVLTQYRSVTDRQTDGHTDRHVAIAITRASIASRG